MDWAAFITRWREGASAQGFEVETITKKGGFDIIAARKGRAGPQIYLSAGVHGDEPAGPLALMRLLDEEFFADGFQWMVCPALNPVGLTNGKRENGEGIDLNRDYLAQETPEVRAHIDWLERLGMPQLFLSLHEDWESTGIYYYEINTGGRGPSYEQLMAAASPFFPPEPEAFIDDHEVTRPGWIYHASEPDIPEGWPEAIYLAKNGCELSLTFETPSSQPLEDRIQCHLVMVQEAVAAFTPASLHGKSAR